MNEKELELLHWYRTRYYILEKQLVSLRNHISIQKRNRNTIYFSTANYEKELNELFLFIYEYCHKNRLDIENIIEMSIIGKPKPKKWNPRINDDYFNNDYSIEDKYKKFIRDIKLEQDKQINEIVFFDNNMEVNI